jgi:hypothetical protein
MRFFDIFNIYTWAALAALLVAAEVILPGMHLIWFGVAAAVIAALVWFIPFSGEVQLVLFGLASLVAVYYGRRLTATPAKSDAPFLNERAHQYIGREVVVEDAIERGRGRVRVGDTLWLAEGPNLPAGAKVTVKDVKGTVLVVE